MSVTPPFSPDTWQMSGDPCEMIVRQLSGACQMYDHTYHSFIQVTCIIIIWYEWCVEKLFTTNIQLYRWYEPSSYFNVCITFQRDYQFHPDWGLECHMTRVLRWLNLCVLLCLRLCCTESIAYFKLCSNTSFVISYLLYTYFIFWPINPLNFSAALLNM